MLIEHEILFKTFFVHNSNLKNSAVNDVLPRHVFAVLTRKRWAKKSVQIFDAHTVRIIVFKLMGNKCSQ